MTLLVKICGIRTANAANVAVESGASMLGFNFVPTSPRKVSPEEAKAIVAALPKRGRPKLVGVFQNEKIENVKKIIEHVGLDMAQLHGSESAAFAEKLGVPVIKAVALEPDFDVTSAGKLMTGYPAQYFLLDRIERGKGKRLDYRRVEQLAASFPIILAGGLEPHTVREAIRGASNIAGVDVAGGVETGEKQELRKIRQFIREANTALS